MRPRDSRRIQAIALGVALLSAARVARADTEEGSYYSDDAAIMAGAVTSWTRDAGAVWYNPAGLGGETRAQLTLNGSLYALKIREIPNALSTHFPGTTRSIDLESSDIMSAPHATAMVFRLSDNVALGLGIYISERDVRTAQNTLEFTALRGSGVAFDANLRQHIDAASEVTKYNAGPAIGWEIARHLRVGANTFITYTRTSSLALFEVDITGISGTPPPTVFALNNQHVNATEFGLVGALGVQWDPTPEWHLGATLRAPEVRLSQSIGGSAIGASSAVVSGVAPSAQLSFVHAREGNGVGLKVPFRALLSAAHVVSDRVMISMEGDILPAIDDSATRVKTRTVVNARLGLRASLSERLVAGVGFFSDRDRQVLGNSLTDERIDRYGVTAGLQFLAPFTLETDDGPAPNGLILGTTIALRYAMGLGEVRALDYDSVTGRSFARAVDVMYHEWTPYIGSAVSF